GPSCRVTGHPCLRFTTAPSEPSDTTGHGRYDTRPTRTVCGAFQYSTPATLRGVRHDGASRIGRFLTPAPMTRKGKCGEGMADAPRPLPVSSVMVRCYSCRT